MKVLKIEHLGKLKCFALTLIPTLNAVIRSVLFELLIKMFDLMVTFIKCVAINIF